MVRLCLYERAFIAASEILDAIAYYIFIRARLCTNYIFTQFTRRGPRRNYHDASPLQRYAPLIVSDTPDITMRYKGMLGT